MRLRVLSCSTGFLLLVVVSCSIHPPDIKITDEKTALENQVLGTYNEIEEDVWMVASVRSSEPGEKVELSKEKEAVLRAYQNREFNRDDIEEFLADGCVGEANDGLLVLRTSDRFESDEAYRGLVERKVAEENRDREVIIARIVEVNAGGEGGDRDGVVKVFARMNRDNAAPGHWVQDENGAWKKRK